MIDNLASLLKKNGLRKIATGLYMFTCLCALVWAHRIDNPTYSACAMALIGALFTANAAEHFAGAKKDDSKQSGKNDQA